ncbi:hypothetical protein SteCoe_23318 [Stentor coeruleus]|uniref:RING-type domain-containing protein n=1 Tax=Stentor coeruleus TaxID=5963 RepID=A0A1R2BK46_9CILI|nr:hypothetical protein SteCoe_23318 [Stentor coeruleus]
MENQQEKNQVDDLKYKDCIEEDFFYDFHDIQNVDHIQEDSKTYNSYKNSDELIQIDYRKCQKCMNDYDLGKRKPIEICCKTFCYSCIFCYIEIHRSLCEYHTMPDINLLKPNYSILETLKKNNELSYKSTKIIKLKPGKITKTQIGTCDSCQLQDNELLKLPKMKKGICCKCQVWFVGHKTLIKDFKCVNSHTIIETTDNIVANPKICCICGYFPGIKAHCYKCDVHICVKCTESIKIIIENSSYLNCKCGYEITWKYYKKLKNCGVCLRSIGNLGVFECGKCERGYCYRCIGQINNEMYCDRCFDVLGFEVLPITIGCRHMFCVSCIEEIVDKQQNVVVCPIDKFITQYFNGIKGNKDLGSVRELVCQEEHVLINPKNIRKTCDLCLSANSNIIWPCENCYFLICDLCKQWQDKTYMVREIKIKCPQGHFFREIPFIPSDETQITDKCFYCDKGVKCSYKYCYICKIIMCVYCHTFFENYRNPSCNLKCLCGKKSIWSSRIVEVKCFLCLKINDIGCFYCKYCKKAICFLCFQGLEGVCCKVCGLNFVESEDIWDIQTCGCFYCSLCVDDLIQNLQKFCLFHSEIALKNPNSQLEMIENAENSDDIIGLYVPECEYHLFSKDYQSDITCDYCLQSKKNLWKCEKCNILVCFDCKEWHESSTLLTQSIFVCVKGHSLRKTHNAEKYYNRNNKYLCDGCLEKKSGKSAHCHICKVDYCNTCCKFIETLTASLPFLVSRNGGKIVWKPKKKVNKCSICNKNYKKIGSFLCVKSWEKYCIKCVLKMCKAQCYLCGTDFFSNFLVPMCLTDMKLICISCIELNCLNSQTFARNEFNIESPLRSINLIPPKDINKIKPICKQHNYQTLTKSRIKCEVCRKKNQILNMCIECEELSCQTCAEWVMKTDISAKKDIKCSKGHFLRKFIIKDDAAMLKCAACGDKNYTKVRYCLQCDFCWCLDCLKNLAKKLKNYSLIACECGGNLIWRSDKICRGCSECFQTSMKPGSFLCVVCEQMKCFRCVKNA